MTTLVKNKTATFNYHILEKKEAGLVLQGQEVKALREKKASLNGSYVTIKEGNSYLVNCNISPYQQKNTSIFYNPRRERRLLLSKKEIMYLFGKAKEKGISLIPLRIYTKNRLIKLEIGVARGKKKYDKREVMKKREIDKRIRRVVKR